MSVRSVLKSEAAAWVLGGALLAGVIASAYWLVGWLGVATVGLFGLLVSTTIALNNGRAVADSGYIGSGDVSTYTRQIERARQLQSAPEQKMAADAERMKRSRVLYLINSVFIGMAVTGIWMFLRHEL